MYFYHKNQKIGPVKVDVIRKLLQEGKISPKTILEDNQGQRAYAEILLQSQEEEPENEESEEEYSIYDDEDEETSDEYEDDEEDEGSGSPFDFASSRSSRSSRRSSRSSGARSSGSSRKSRSSRGSSRSVGKITPNSSALLTVASIITVLTYILLIGHALALVAVIVSAAKLTAYGNLPTYSIGLCIVIILSAIITYFLGMATPEALRAMVYIHARTLPRSRNAQFPNLSIMVNAATILTVMNYLVLLANILAILSMMTSEYLSQEMKIRILITGVIETILIFIIGRAYPEALRALGASCQNLKDE